MLPRELADTSQHHLFKRVCVNQPFVVNCCKETMTKGNQKEKEVTLTKRKKKWTFDQWRRVIPSLCYWDHHLFNRTMMPNTTPK